MKLHRSIRTLAPLALLVCSSAAFAQDAPTSPPGGEGPTTVPGPSTTTTTVTQPYGGPAPGEVDSYLPSSSQSTTDVNASRSGFDLNKSTASREAQT